jgi:hypothetical protein
MTWRTPVTSGLSCFRMIFSESLGTSVRKMLVIKFKNLEKEVAL